VIGWYWIVWFALATVCFAVEIVSPTYFFLSFGTGAIIAGIFSLITTSVPFQIIVFVIVVFLSYIWIRKIRHKFFITAIDTGGAIIYGARKYDGEKLIEREGIVTKAISTKSRGYVKINNEEWPAILRSSDVKTAEVGERVKVVTIKENRLIVGQVS